MDKICISCDCGRAISTSIPMDKETKVWKEAKKHQWILLK